MGLELDRGLRIASPAFRTAQLLQRRRTFLFLLRRTFFSTVLKQKFYNITRLLMYSHQLRIFSYGTHKESLIFLTGNRLLSNSLFFLVMFEWYETHIEIERVYLGTVRYLCLRGGRWFSSNSGIWKIYPSPEVGILKNYPPVYVTGPKCNPLPPPPPPLRTSRHSFVMLDFW